LPGTSCWTAWPTSPTGDRQHGRAADPPRSDRRLAHPLPDSALRQRRFGSRRLDRTQPSATTSRTAACARSPITIGSRNGQHSYEGRAYHPVLAPSSAWSRCGRCPFPALPLYL
jgi:hypothetical protein